MSIYLDYASLTPIDKGVMKEMKKYSTGEYTNPSALYASAVKAKKAMEDARTRIAKVMHAHADEIIFTSGGTESNNLALLGILGERKTGHIIVSAIEHSSIIETARALEKKGFRVTYIPVNAEGIVDIELLKKSISKETILVSVMMVNNEIGTIEPIREIAKIVRDANKDSGKELEERILFHTDACQAPIHLPVYVEQLGIDLLTLDGHKIYGPRGVGILYKKRSVALNSIIHGGSQEKGLRSGTENIPGMQGFAYALELAEKNRDKETRQIVDLKNFFISELIKIKKEIKINGSIDNSTPHILNVSIPNIDSEFFVLQLDAKGIECSTKSACLRDEDESYVLRAIGAASKNSVRFSFGRNTSKGDLKKTLKTIAKILQK